MLAFDKPQDDLVSLELAARKGILPTTLTSAQLAQLDQELKQRSVFSARLNVAGPLDALQDNLELLVSGSEDEHGRIRSIPEAKAQLKEAMLKAGVRIAPVGTRPIKDFYSDARRQLMVQTTVLDTLGAAQQVRRQNPVALDVNPGLELVRLRVPKGGEAAERDWVQRWKDALYEIGSDAESGVTNPDDADGRMVALVNHPIWLALGQGAGGYNDSLGNPWAPFAFNSGMGQEPVPRRECVDLGIIGENDVVSPDDSIDINEGLEANVAKFDAAMQRQLAGGGLKIVKGILKIANRRRDAVRVVGRVKNGPVDELRDALGRWTRTGSFFRSETREARRTRDAFVSHAREVRELNAPKAHVATGIFAAKSAEVRDFSGLKTELSPLAAKMKAAQDRAKALELSKRNAEMAEDQARGVRRVLHLAKIQELRQAKKMAHLHAVDAIQKGQANGQTRFIFTHPETGQRATIDFGTKKHGMVASVREGGGHAIHADLNAGVQALHDKGYVLQRATLKKTLAKKGIIINRRGRK